MSTKLSSGILLIGTAIILSGCSYFRNRSVKDIVTDPFSPTEAEYIQAAREMGTSPVRQSSSVVVCRSHQCAPAKLSMSKEYIYNSLLHLFDNNNYQKVLICQADAASHTCLENYITLPITVGITPTNVYIDSVKISDVIIGKKASSLNLVLNYNLTYGGQTPECSPAQSILFAKSINHVLMEDSGYQCKMTSVGQSTIKTVFSIDYVDLDYGYIGGYYSIGLSGPAFGGGNGYMMLRLPKNAYPLSPQLKSPKPKKQKQSIGGLPSKTTEETDGDSSYNVDNVEIFPINKK